MKFFRYGILICLSVIPLLSGCSNDGTSPFDYWITELSDEQAEQYNDQIGGIISKIDDVDIKRIIYEVSSAQYVKSESIIILNNEGVHPSRFLDYATGQIREAEEYIYKIGTLTYIPFGRRYIVASYVYFEELVVRKVVIVIEIEEDDSIKVPYHMYAFDISAKIRYRGEGASNVSTYDVLSYEYGRLPDVKKEN